MCHLRLSFLRTKFVKPFVDPMHYELDCERNFAEGTKASLLSNHPSG
jgi:hypothetical protein